MEISLAEFGYYIGVLVAPSVPLRYSAFQQIDVFLVCHTTSSKAFYLDVLCFRFEISQQAVECIQITIVVLPMGKVAHVARVANESRPSSLALHHSRV